MTQTQANTLLQAAGSPYAITRTDRRRPPWCIQLGDKRGAVTFRTLDEAVRFAVNTAPHPARAARGRGRSLSMEWVLILWWHLVTGAYGRGSVCLPKQDAHLYIQAAEKAYPALRHRTIPCPEGHS
jgi:hypothetical protein